MKKDSKALIRKQYISKRDSLTPIERREKSNLICKKLLNIPEFEKTQICLLYASFRSEVETDSLITAIMRRGKRIALPITDIKEKRLILCEIKNGLEDLITSTYRIREPRPDKGLFLSPSEIDLFIVPGVAFDISGTRLGYGGGYYDRLLAEVYKKSILALAYEVQIASSLPFDESDIKMKKILTEKQVIDCIRTSRPLCSLNP